MTVWQAIVKRIVDIFISVTLILLLGFPLLLISLIIVLDSRGGVIFRQKRPGKNGVPFELYKFRTMIPNAEKMGAGFFFSGPDDPRITKVGRLLRRTSIDELPQLFNVLKGDMSLVGPRPGLLYQVDMYNEYQKRRLLVRPGITGWAQVNGRTNLSWSRKIKHDLWYIENYSLRLDLIIMLKTIKVVFEGNDIRSDLKPDEIEDFGREEEPERL